MAWNFGDIYDAIGRVSEGEHPALIHAGENGAEGTVISWPEFSARTNRLARYLQNQGLEPGAKVAHYMRNCPAYVEAMVASFKGRFVHVNVNYRYLDDELHYIMDNSDAEAVVYAAEFRPHVEALAARLPKVKCWLEVAPEGQLVPEHDVFTNYGEAVSSARGSHAVAGAEWWLNPQHVLTFGTAKDMSLLGRDGDSEPTGWATFRAELRRVGAGWDATARRDVLGSMLGLYVMKAPSDTVAKRVRWDAKGEADVIFETAFTPGPVAALAVAVPAPGSYVLLAATMDAGIEGAYELAVSADGPFELTTVY